MESEEHDIHHKIATEAYETRPQLRVDDYRLVNMTPTLKIYRNDDGKMIVGVRGTYDKRDVKTDLALGLGRLKQTDRYTSDRNHLAQVLSRYKGDVSVAGHSLGGAIGDRLKSEFPTRIKGGVNFNSAFEPKNLFTKGDDKQVMRYYIKGDPLGALGGKTLSNVRMIDTGKGFGISAHKLDNFKR